MADSGIGGPSAPQDAATEDATPQDTAAQGAAAERRPGGLRHWWRYGSSESSAARSRVSGVVVGFYVSMTICAALTGHQVLAWSMAGIGVFLGMILAAVLWWALERPRTGLSAMAVGAVAAAVVVLLLGDVPPDERDLATAWSVPSERPIGTQAVGSWADGGLVVRVRPDRAVAYRAATGEVAWQWAPPGEDVVCAMSRTTGQGIGLLGHAAHDRPCGTAVALDLATGAPRWTAAVAAPSRVGDPAAPDLLAVAGGTAVLQGTDGWHAAALTDGHELWSSPAGEGCSPLIVAGGSDSVVTVTRCGTDAPVLRELAAADGHPRISTALPVSGAPTRLAVISTAPLTLWVEEAAVRGTHGVIALDADGRVTATVPVVDEYTLDVSLTDFQAFAARPSYGAVVVAGLLLVPAERPGDVVITARSRSTKGRVVAYSLADGSKRWTADLDDKVRGMAVDGDSVRVLTGKGLVGLAAATGQESYDRSGEVGQDAPGDLWVVDRRFVFVNVDGTDGHAPVVAFH